MMKLLFSCTIVILAVLFCFNGIVDPSNGWQEFAVLMLFSIGSGRVGELIYETLFE